jgi:uncharacterized protein YqjF (DUF2071 family)
MPSLSPDERAWPPVLKARWLQQIFVHWPFRPADVQVLLPRGLPVDEYDGMAWVSFTPFLMAGLAGGCADQTPLAIGHYGGAAQAAAALEALA